VGVPPSRIAIGCFSDRCKALAGLLGRPLCRFARFMFKNAGKGTLYDGAYAIK
jgi:hypothetical protein